MFLIVVNTPIDRFNWGQQPLRSDAQKHVFRQPSFLGFRGPGDRRRWLILVHQLPATPSNLRVRTWRRLQELGAVAVKQAVYVLPDSAESREDFEWLRVEIAESGGEALVFSADQLNASADATLIEEFRRARQRSMPSWHPAPAAQRARASRRGRRGATGISPATATLRPPSSAWTFSAVPAGTRSSPCWPTSKQGHSGGSPRPEARTVRTGAATRAVLGDAPRPGVDRRRRRG